LIVIGLYSVLWGKHKEQLENKVVEDIPLTLKGAMVEGNPESNNISSHIISVTNEPPLKSNS